MDEFDIKITAVEDITLSQNAPSWRSMPYQTVGIPGNKQVQVAAHNNIFQQVHAHASSNLNEIGGILVGQVTTWDGQTYVEVKATIAGDMKKSGPAHVTFTADSWMALLQAQERDYPDQMIVGWYHSHPRMGIFLSGLDLDIHNHFFKEPWHIALVANGQDQKMGFFVWDKQHVRAVDGFYILDTPSTIGFYPNQGHFDYNVQPAPSLDPLSWREWVAMILLIAIIYLLSDLWKCWLRRRNN